MKKTILLIIIVIVLAIFVYAADITVDSAVNAYNNENAQPRSLIWADKDTGYIFFRDLASDLHYRKTTDAGATWGTEATIRTGSVMKFAIWYDKWTKNDTGDVIHIVFTDTADDDITYNSFSTSDDTLDGEVIVLDGTGTSSTNNWGAHCLSIVKARGGNVYVGGWINPSGEQGFWNSSNSPATSFSSRTSMADGSAVDGIMFLAGNEEDSNDIWSIYQDLSANEITLKVYNNSGNFWNESAKIEDVTEEAGFFSFDAMDRHSDGHAILADWNGKSIIADLAVFDITDINTQTAKTDVHTNRDNAYGVALLINQQNDDLYVASIINVDVAGSVYYVKSSDGGGSWETTIDLSVTDDDHRAVFGGSSVGEDGGRWQPIWFNDDLTDLMTNKDNSVELVTEFNLVNVTQQVTTIDPYFYHLNISKTSPYDQLVGYWNFDGDKIDTKLTTHYDFTGNNISGTGVADANVSSAGCMYGDCLQLDGTGDGVNLGSSSSLDGMSDLTISSWVKLNALNANQRIISAWGDSGNQAYVLAIDNSNNPVWAVDTETQPNANVVTATGVTVTTGTWYYIVATYNNALNNVSIYVDGNYEGGSIDVGGNIGITTLNTHIGIESDGSSYPFNGTIDEVMIFNTTLSPSNITAIYNNLSARFFAQGTQDTKNSISIDTGNNRVNVTTAIENNSGSAVKLSVDYYDGSWSSTASQTITSGVKSTFTISSTTTAVHLNYTLVAGDLTNPFYTPIVFDNFTVSEFNVVITDTTAPTVTLIVPANNTLFTASNSIDFNYSATDDTAVTNCSLFINETYNASNVGTSNFTSTAIGDGNYHWFINCSDAIPNWGYSGFYNLTVQAAADITIPTYTNWQNNASTLTKINGVVNWSIDFADNSLNYYFFAHNQSGALLNVTNKSISGTTAFVNYTLDITLIKDNYICGQYWVNDTAGNQNQTNLSCFTVTNTAPDVTTPLFNDTSPKLNEDVGANTTYSDGDSDSGTVYFKWYINDTNIWNDTFTSIASGSVLISNISSTNYSKTDRINVSVYANDGTDDSTVLGGTEITIANTAPVCPSLAAQSDHVGANATYIHPAGTDADSDPLTYYTNFTSSSGQRTYTSSTLTFQWYPFYTQIQLWNFNFNVSDSVTTTVCSSLSWNITNVTAVADTCNLECLVLSNGCAATALGTSCTLIS